MMLKKVVFSLLVSSICLMLFSSNAIAFDKGEKNDKTKNVKKDSVSKKADKYTEFIKGTEVKKGMFNIYKKDSKLYLEIPTKLMSRNFLISSRVSTSSRTWQINPGEINNTPLHVTFSADNNKVYIHFPPVYYECDPNSEMYPAFVRSNNYPIWKSFSVEAIAPDSSSYIFDCTSLFLSSIKEFSPFPNLPNEVRSIISFGGSFESDRSRIEEFKAFEDNIIVKSMMTYTTQEEGPQTTIESRNIILLPEKPMKPRYADERVGFFNEQRFVFDENRDKLQRYSIINRWDLQPREEDIEKYKNGELVEPEKPIVWYVDTAIPEKWRKFVRLGIADWNIAFEQIGFKNVIQVKDYPQNDPNFDPDDIHYNCYRFIATSHENSMGPSWIDPRSGQILCGDVLSWYGVVTLLNKWRMIQTAAVDPSVRCATMTDENMGEAMRYVAAHEVGHTLGLMHNFGASAAYPVEKLRDPEFTQKYGTTPSIMDYARFNYVAQPGDKERGVKLTPPLIGEYDKFAIKYGYKPILDIDNPKQERSELKKWVDELLGNKLFFYGKQVTDFNFDPRSQAEDLGDDAVKANSYGMKNLKYVAENFVDWMSVKGEGTDAIFDTYKEIISQFGRFVEHPMVMVGGMYINDKYNGDPVKLYEFVPKDKQKEALKFVLTNLEDAPNWLINDKILAAVGPTAKAMVKSTQFFNEMLTREVMGRMELAEVGGNTKDVYTVDEYIGDIFKFVFADKKGSLNLTQMSFQNTFVDNLKGFVSSGEFQASSKGLKDLHSHSVTCSCHKFCANYTNSFSPKDPLSELVLTPRINASLKRPVVHKYLVKAQKLAKERQKKGDEATRNHYALLVKKLNYLINQ